MDQGIRVVLAEKFGAFYCKYFYLQS